MMEESKTYTDSAISDLIKEFLLHYKDDNGNYKYVKAIDESISSVHPTLTFSPRTLIETKLDYGLEINHLLNSQSRKFLQCLKRAVKEIFEQRHGTTKTEITVEIDEVQNQVSIVEALSKDNIGKIVTLSGMVTYKSDIYNKLIEADFTCENGHSNHITQSTKDIKVPVVCSHSECKSRDFELNEANSIFETYRSIAVKSDEDFSFTNDEVTVILSGHFTEYVHAGDRIKLTGLVKSNHKSKAVSYLNEIQCLYVRQLQEVDLEISDNDIEKFREMVEDLDFYKKMINSIAPNILGNDEVKESLLLQLVRSPDQKKSDGTMTRGWFNIGLWGDAGVAKTAMSEHIKRNYPKTQLISSKGATDVGLTLGIDQDPNGNRVLRAGAFVMNRGYGTVILDEFPRLNPEVIDGIMTTIENGIASIAKAGFQAEQRADSSLLATGNAFDEDWNENLNLKDNLNISTALLQRFDYHWIIRDTYSESKDLAITNSVLSGSKFEEQFEPYPSSLLVKYFKYVRKCDPELSDDAKQHIQDSYVQLRKDEQTRKEGFGVRHLNTIIRTTLAIARLYQRKYATIEDVDKAITLIRKNMRQRGITISEADTYVTRQFNRALAILKEVSAMGIGVEELFDGLHKSGSKEEIQQTIADIGTEKSLNTNKRWRTVVKKIRSSPMVNVVSKRPMVLAYRHEKLF